jgi:thiamine-phosphate pyrophosphorylase
VRVDSNAHKSRLLLELYVIIDEGLLGGQSVNDLIEDAIRGGADAIQYRAKRLSKKQYHEKALSLLPITRYHNVPFFVNDHLDIALAISSDGVHLGQNDLPLPEARRLMPDRMMLGVSTHSLAEASKAVKDGPDYIAIGSVFPTTTKENPEAIIGTELIRSVKNAVGEIPLVAIGGINVGNVAEVIRSGADGVAVASAVVRSASPSTAAKELKRQILAARKS